MVRTLETLLGLSKDFGPVLVVSMAVVAVNLFFIWQSVKREERQNAVIANMQKRHDDVVVKLLTECKEAIASSREAIAQNSQILVNWIANAGR